MIKFLKYLWISATTGCTIIACTSIRTIESLHSLRGKTLTDVEAMHGKARSIMPFFGYPTYSSEADYGSFVVRLDVHDVVVGVMPKYWIALPFFP